MHQTQQLKVAEALECGQFISPQKGSICLTARVTQWSEC